MNFPMSGMSQTITDPSLLPPGLADAIKQAREKDRLDKENNITDAVIKEPKAAEAASDETIEIGEPIPRPEVQAPAPELVPVFRRKELTIQLGVLSPCSPPPFIFIGTSKVESNYAKWLEKQMKEMMATASSEKQGVKKVAAQRFMYTICFMAMATALVEKLSFKWISAPVPRKLNVAEAVESFIQTNKSMLMMLAPYYGVKERDFDEPGSHKSEEAKEASFTEVAQLNSSDTLNKTLQGGYLPEETLVIGSTADKPKRSDSGLFGALVIQD